MRGLVPGTGFRGVVGMLGLVAAWSLACGGGSDAPVSAPQVDEQAPAPVEVEPVRSAVQLDGTWQIRPVDDELRRLRVIDAAFKGKQARERLGTMTGEEQNLYREWKQKKGDDLAQMKSQLKFMKNCKFEFKGESVTVRFDDETHGPVAYTVLSSSDQQTVLTFDPGLGNGVETHSISWDTPNKGTNDITSVSGEAFIPLVIKRMK